MFYEPNECPICKKGIVTVFWIDAECTTQEAVDNIKPIK